MSHDFNFDSSNLQPTNFNFNFTLEEAGPTITTHYILKGATNNFIAIWADADAGLATGKMYVSSSAAFTIVNLAESPNVHDWYTQTHSGRAGEVLDSDNIIDLNSL